MEVEALVASPRLVWWDGVHGSCWRVPGEVGGGTMGEHGGSFEVLEVVAWLACIIPYVRNVRCRCSPGTLDLATGSVAPRGQMTPDAGVVVDVSRQHQVEIPLLCQVPLPETLPYLLRYHFPHTLRYLCLGGG